eukprot:Em0121g7a
MTDLELKIEETRGESVCFVFDGLDEYIKPYSTDENCWFEQVLRGEELTCSTIVVTSRPNASVELRKTVHIRGEVLGFLTKQIDEYIVKSYPDSSTKVEELQTYLHSHPNIKHMCYVPFNLVMIIFIFNKCHKKTTPLPETETDVYRQFTIMSLIRYFRKENRKIELRDLETLPYPEISMFQIISKLAYTTVIASKTSITQEELRPMCEESSIASLANLGILVVDENEEECGASHVLTFVHLTHQEFLAAYYASRLPSGEQLKAISEDIVQPHMGVVLKFFCGITKLQNPDHWAAIMDILQTYKDGRKMPVTLRALHCVFESQNGQRCRELFSKADGKLQIVNDTLTLLDYSVIGYCLESARNTVRSIVLWCQLTAEGLDNITKQLTTMENVKNLQIRDDLCQKEKLLALKHLLQKLPKVESLDLKGCFKDKPWSDSFLLGELLKQTSHLQRLKVKAASFFEPYQFGVACPRGAERIIHDLRACVEEHWFPAELFSLSVLNISQSSYLGQSLCRCLSLLQVHGPALGLLVNESKCEVFSHHNLDVFPSGMKASDKPNIVILGVAIGDLDFCSSFISTKRMEARALLFKLEQVGVLDPQVALVLLRLCEGFCKLVHLARSTPPSLSSQALSLFDNDIRRVFSECTGVDTSDTAWKQAQLSLSRGGLGLRSLSHHSSAAYISSICSSGFGSKSVHHLSQAVEVFNNLVFPVEPINVESVLLSPPIQKTLSSKFDDHLFNNLITISSLADKARLLSISSPHASAWLSVTPSEGLGLHLDPPVFQIAVKWWLGLDTSEDSQCTLCPSVLDHLGHHAVTCKYGGDVATTRSEISWWRPVGVHT